MQSSNTAGQKSRRLFIFNFGKIGFFCVTLSNCGQKRGNVNSENLTSTEPKVIGITKIFPDGEFRIIQSNGLPTHETGVFPNKGCPFPIREHTREFKVPLKPKDLSEPRFAKTWRTGVGINGALFEPWGPSWKQDCNTGWTYEDCGTKIREHLGLDSNNAHVQNFGSYHYHGYPEGLIALAKKDQPESKMLLIGFAADGYPIYDSAVPKDPKDLNSEKITLKSSYRLKSGPRGDNAPEGDFDGSFNEDYEFVEGLGDLDRCNGRFGLTPDFPGGTYYYVVTKDYPYIPRYFKAEPSESFRVPDDACFAPLPPSLGGTPDKNAPPPPM